MMSVYPLDIPSIQKLQNIVIIDKLTSKLVIHNQSSRLKGRVINVLFTKYFFNQKETFH